MEITQLVELSIRCLRLKKMTNDQDKINQLLSKLENLLKRQDDFSRDIDSLRIEITNLQSYETEKNSEKIDIKEDKPIIDSDFEIAKAKTTPDSSSSEQQIKKELPGETDTPVNKPPKIKLDLEKFIGENLINKIGIIITVIGVAIGAKYSIENDLISPLTRIILGYLAGIGLLGFGIKLKKNYENYSAVLVSGAIAIMYFITYSAYSFYDLIPQTMAFLLMVVFTIFTVVAAINYNKQVIAHIGLVGAYAVPYLLSENSGQVAILFSYMAIINVGILVISFKKYWKPLYYSSFGLTWLIFFLWYVSDYQTEAYYGLALTFLSIFFVIFYLVFLAYKLIRKEKFRIENIALLLINSFIFYGVGYAILDDHETGKQLLGIFTLCNAILHFIVSAIIYKQKLADKNLFYLVSGLVLVFITITIPVQLDGNWVTLLWIGEAALLFWIGRTKAIAIYEKLSYILMFLAFFSIFQDWTTVYDGYYVEQPETRITPLLNINFLTSLLFIAAFGFINFLNRNKNYSHAFILKKRLSKIIYFSIPAMLFITIYYAFRMEIANYWDQLYIDSALSINSESDSYNFYRNYDLRHFKTIWIINYSLLFVSVLSFLNTRILQDKKVGLITFSLIAFTMLVFLTQGLYAFSELRETYLDQSLLEYYKSGVFNIGIRYVSFVFIATALFMCYKATRQKFMHRNFKKIFDFILHISTIWIFSSELINWMDIAEYKESYKLGLSILWGVYSLLLIVLGIWKNKKHLRVGAIILFGITLIKLFLYDISHLNTIAKTIVFVSLGILLLIISFLYNKNKHNISDEIEN